MKKLLIFIAMISLFASCKKTSYVANFDKTPQERAADQISLVGTTLTSSPNGWIATLPTFSGGGFGFYMNFDKEQNVTMYADLTDGSATVAGKSYYRVKQDIGTSLVFDSYSYLAMLDDPNPAVYGGENKIGFKSDIDFIFDKVDGDSILFIGKKYRQPFKLVKATATQKAAFEAGAYKTAIDKLKAYFTANNNPYVEIVSGSTTLKIGVTPNLSSIMNVAKRIDFTGVLADGKTINSKGAKFAYKLDGAEFLNGGFTYEGITFVKLAWKDATTLAAYDSNGKEYILKNSVTPLVPIDLLWGIKYTQLFSAYRTIYPGTTTTGAAILNYFHNNVTSRPLTGFDFVKGDITLIWDRVNKRLRTNARVAQAGNPDAGWITETVYDYTVDNNNVYKFTQRTAASGGYATNIIVQFHQFLLANRVTFDFHVDGTNLYGKMKSVENPTTEMTFILR